MQAKWFSRLFGSCNQLCSPLRSSLRSTLPRARRLRKGAIQSSSVEVLEERSLLTPAFWTSDLSGFWDDPANWALGHVPGIGDDVIIDRPGFDPVITIRDSYRINSINTSESLVVTNGTLQVDTGLDIDDSTVTLTAGAGLRAIGPLTITNGGTLDWQGGELIGASLVNSGTVIVSATTDVRLSGHLTNNGTINYSGSGSILFDGSTQLLNSASGIFDITGDGDFGLSGFTGGFSPFFQNNGTLRKSAGLGVSQFNGIALNSSSTGVFDVDSGRLNASSSGTWTGGTFTGGPWGVLEVSGNYTLSGAFNGVGNGQLELTGTLVSSVPGATLDFPTNYFQMVGGTVIGSGGGFVNSGFVTIASPSDVRLGSTFTNNGTMTHAGAGSILLDGSTQLINSAGAVFNFAGDGDFGQSGNTGGFAPFVQNQGTLRKSAGTGISIFNGIQLNNTPTGVIDVLAGRLNIANSSNTWTGGTFTGGPDGVLEVSGSVGISGNLTGTGAGRLELTGVMNSANNGANLNFPDGYFQWLSGAIFGSGAGINNQAFLSIPGPSDVRLGSTFTNNGTMTHAGAGSILLDGSTQLINSAGALFSFAGDGDFGQSGNTGGFAPFVQNQGTLRKSAGTGISIFNGIQLDNTPTGVIDVLAGRLTIANSSNTWTGGTFAGGPDGVLEVSGSVGISGDLTGMGDGRLELTGVMNSANNGANLNFPVGYFQWLSGAMFGSGTGINNQGFLSIPGAFDVRLGSTLNNTGTITQAGSLSVLFDGSTRLINHPGAVYDFAGDGDFGQSGFTGGFAPFFQNEGTLRKSAGSDESIINGVALNIVATGVIDVLSGRLIVAGAGTWTNPTLNAAANSVLEVASNVGIEGTLTGSGAGHLELAGGFQTINAGATFNFPGDYFHWTAGTISGGPSLTNAGTWTLTGPDAKVFSQANVLNTGTIIVAGSGDFVANKLTNQVGGLVELQGAVRLIAGEVSNNSGTIRKTGAGTGQIDVRINNSDTGVIDVQVGRLNLSRGGSFIGTTFQVSAGTVLEFSGTDVFSLTGSYQVAGPGLIEWNSFLNGVDPNNPARLVFPENQFQVLSGQLLGTIINDGWIELATTVGVFIRSVITNNGTFVHSGTGDFVMNANTRFFNNGLYDLQTDADLMVPNDGSNIDMRFINSGVLRKSGGLGLSAFRHEGNFKELRFDNSGTVEVQSGTLSFNDTVVQASGATLLGGTWIVNAFSTLTMPGSSNFTTNQANVTLNGQQAQFTNFAVLANNQGAFTVTGGALFPTLGALSNNGDLTVGPASTLTVNGDYTQLPFDRLVSWWRGDANTIDSAGGQNGTLTNNTTYATGEFGTAFSFDGTQDYVTLTGTPSLSNYTISAWIRRTDLTKPGIIFTGFSNYAFGTLADGRLFLEAFGTTQVNSGPLAVTDTTFHHIAVTKSSSAVTFYVDGVPQQVGGFLTQANLSPFTIGGVPGTPGRDFQGQIDEVTLLNRPLSAAEITELMSSNDPENVRLQQPSLSIEIDGRPASNQFGKLQVNGIARFEGELNIANAQGFGPTRDDQYPILNYQSRIGSFTSLTGLSPYYVADIGNTQTVLNVVTMAADLAVTTINVPATAAPGETVSIQYTVANLQQEGATGDWFDSLYLSSDGVFDPSDILLGRVEHTGGVGSLGTYSQSLSTSLPAVIDGSYQVIVIAAGRGDIADVNRNNNKLASSPISVSVPILTFDTLVTRPLSNGQDILYRLQPSAGGDVQLDVDFEVLYEGEVYVKYGSLPTRSDFDFAGGNLLALHQSILLPAPAALPVYVLIHGREGANGTTMFQLRAENIVYELRGITESRGANVGPVTTSVLGAGLTRLTRVELLNDQGVVIAVAATTFVNPNELAATFNLNGVAPGIYDVRITDVGQQDVLADAFEVVTGIPGTLRIDVLMPGSARGGRVVTGYIDYTNTGLTDLIAPIIFINSATNSVMTLDLNAEPTSTRLRILGTGDQGPIGILRPGEKVRVPFRILANANPFTVQTQYVLADRETPMDWDIAREDLLPLSLTDPQFEAVMTQMIAQVGDSQGDFVRMLATNASLLPESVGNPRSIPDLLNLEYRRAKAALNTSITGQAVSDEPRILLAGVRLSAVNTDTKKVYSTITLNDGSFIFETVTPGNYEFQIAGGLILNPAVNVIAGQHVTGVEAEVISEARVIGRIVRPNGNPIPAARVYVFQGSDLVGSSFTDNQGRFGLGRLSPGEYSFVVHAEGYERAQIDGVVLTQGDNTTNIQVNDVPARITGHVTLNGAPPNKLYVSARDEQSNLEINFFTVFADQNGAFVLDNLPAGTYTIVLIDGDTAISLEGIVVSTSEQLDLGDIEMIPAGPAPFARGLSDSGDGMSIASLTQSISDLLLQAELLRVEARMRHLWISAAETHWGVQDAALWSLYLDGSSDNPPGIQRLGLSDEVVFGGTSTTNLLFGVPSFVLSGFQNAGQSIPGFKDSSALDQAPFSAIYRAIVNDVQTLLDQGVIECGELIEQQAMVISLSDTAQLPLAGLRIGVTGNKSFGVNKRVDDQLHFDGLNYHGIFEIPGNLAGGGNTPPGVGGGAIGQVYADERWVEGFVIITPLGPDTVKVDFSLDMVTFDTIDFMPGNIGEGLEPYMTADLLFLELHDRAYDVPFEARFPLLDDRFPDAILTIPRQDEEEGCDDDEEDDEFEREDGGSGGTGLVFSSDPNDIIGPAGWGPEHFMRVDQNFPYTVLFENKPEATAPAQEVVITQQLDSDLDWSTFELGEFGFGDLNIQVPEGRSFYETRVDLSETHGYFVDFTAGIDLSTGLVTWQFTTIDSETGDLVADALAGFLPPNGSDHQGEGFVSYFISPQASLTTGATITAQASIIFDTNEPILTPIYINRIDTGIPTSTVNALAPTQDFPNFTVSWSGVDDAAGPTGAGVALYDIYVSDNGGEFVPFLIGTAQTSAMFSGQVNHSYSFYSVATDGVGFRQPTPLSGQTSTQVLDVQFDFGDAPDPFINTAGKYPTLLVNDGARHKLGSGLFLGSNVDREFEGQPTATANGDDASGTGDDEDGVILSGLIRGSTGSATVTASLAGKLDAWIDFNRDGDWSDPGEQIATSVSVVAGSNALFFPVPATASLGSSFARFRISSAGGLAVTGSANDGEVEDYQVQINAPLLTQSGPAVTFIKKQSPVTVVPQISVPFSTLTNGVLTITVNAVGTKRKILDGFTFPAITNLGTSTGPQFANGQLTLTIQLNGTASASAIQTFLRGITFTTKGKGLKFATRTLNVSLANSTGSSTTVTQTINVRKK